jgi:hypothetical protein
MHLPASVRVYPTGKHALGKLYNLEDA